MDFEAAEPIQAALQEQVKHKVYGYGVAPEGLAPAVINHLHTYHDWQVDPEWIVWLPGVVSGLAVSCRAYCPDDHEIVVNPPIYHHFFDAHEINRQRIIRVPLHKVGNRWTNDMVAMEAAFNDKTRLMLMCSPHNPAGTVFSAEELQAVGELCDRYAVIMVSDEIHCDLVIDKSVSHVPTAKACRSMDERVITLMSGSKTWNLAGLNCSFAIIRNKSLRKQFRAAAQSIVPGVPPLAYSATEAAYQSGGAWRLALLDYLSDNHAYLTQELKALPGLEVQPIQATYLAWIDASGLGLKDTQGFFEQHGVGLSSGEQFGQPQFIRLNLACPRKMLVQGIERIKRAVGTLGQNHESSTGLLERQSATTLAKPEFP